MTTVPAKFPNFIDVGLEHSSVGNARSLQRKLAEKFGARLRKWHLDALHILRSQKEDVLIKAETDSDKTVLYHAFAEWRPSAILRVISSELDMIKSQVSIFSKQ